MKNLAKVVFVIFSIMFFSGIKGFAQQADLPEIKSAFQKMDVDKDGFVSSSEMQAYQAEQFKELDKDKNGSISVDELEADKTKMFQKADKNMDGKVSSEESGLQFKEYFQQMDKNQDGKVSEAEYTDYWKLIHRF